MWPSVVHACALCSERGVPLGVAGLAAALHVQPDQDAQDEPARDHQHARARQAPERALSVRLDLRGAHLPAPPLSFLSSCSLASG